MRKRKQLENHIMNGSLSILHKQLDRQIKDRFYFGISLKLNNKLAGQLWHHSGSLILRQLKEMRYL